LLINKGIFKLDKIFLTCINQKGQIVLDQLHIEGDPYETKKNE